MIRKGLRLSAIILCLCGVFIALATVFGRWRNQPVLSFIATAEGARDIFILDPATGSLINITQTPYSEWDFAWSSDGQRLLYSTSLPSVSGDRILWRERVASGAEELPITSLIAFDLGWSPDSRVISYYSSHPRNYSDLYRVALPDGNSENLTNTPNVSEENPIWSPDGRYLAYLSKGDLYTLDTTTGEAQRLTQTPSIEEKPIWSPDGLWIAFFRVTGDQERSVHLVDHTGQQEVLLDLPVSPGSHPVSWSPDSAYLVIGLANQQIVEYGRSEEAYQVLYESEQRSYAPLWSPDGAHIAWLEDRSIQILHRPSGTVRTFAQPIQVFAPLVWLQNP